MGATSVGSACPDIAYAGAALSGSQTYYWRIKFWDAAGGEGDWSSGSASFAMSAQDPWVWTNPTPTGYALRSVSFPSELVGYAVGNYGTILMTTDHGSVRCMRGSKVVGDKEASTSLRYKYGRNLKVDEKNAVFVKTPSDFKLPRTSVTTNYILAKEDYYFVYPTDFHRYLSQYRDSFQHGGISMEEMILPIVKLEAK